jgi:hypothetical protein
MITDEMAFCYYDGIQPWIQVYLAGGQPAEKWHTRDDLTINSLQPNRFQGLKKFLTAKHCSITAITVLTAKHGSNI